MILKGKDLTSQPIVNGGGAKQPVAFPTHQRRQILEPEHAFVQLPAAGRGPHNGIAHINAALNKRKELTNPVIIQISGCFLPGGSYA